MRISKWFHELYTVLLSRNVFSLNWTNLLNSLNNTIEKQTKEKKVFTIVRTTKQSFKTDLDKIYEKANKKFHITNTSKNTTNCLS